MRLHPSRFGLRTRLLALVLLPAFLLAALGGTAALRQRHVAEAIIEVRDQMRVLAELTDLRRALLEARMPVEIEVRATELGVDRKTALRLLKVDDPGTDGLDDVATRLRALPAVVRPFTPARLDAVRAKAEGGADLALIDQFDQLDALARRGWEQRLRALRGEVVDTGSSGLNHRLDDLESSTRGSSAAIAMVTELADYWFGALSDPDRIGPARAAIAVAFQQFDQALTDLATSSDPAVAATAQRIADRTGTPFDAAISDAIVGRPE